MGAVPKPIQEMIQDYIKRISTQIPIKKALLFGSYAKGTYTKDSDIDIAVFSDYFKNMQRIEAFRLLMLEAMNYNIDLQPQPFDIEDYENPVGIVEEIIKTGVEIPV